MNHYENGRLKAEAQIANGFGGVPGYGTAGKGNAIGAHGDATRFKVGDKVSYYKSGYRTKQIGKITKIDHDGWIHIEGNEGVAVGASSITKA